MLTIIAGMRVDKVDNHLLERLSKSNVLTIAFGHESGSDKILRYYGKGVTAKQNLDTTLLCMEYNILPKVQLVIGSEMEDWKTIYETLRFVKATKLAILSCNYVIPLPETPIWNKAISTGAISNPREFLSAARKYGPSYLLPVNLTKYYKIVLIFWNRIIYREVNIVRHRSDLLSYMYHKTYAYAIYSTLRSMAKLFIMKFR